MQTLGIDLSTDPKKVWTCEIDWAQQPPVVVSLRQLAALPDPLEATTSAAANRPASHAKSPRPEAHTDDGAPRRRPLIRTEASLIAGLVDLIAAFAPTKDRVIGIDAPLGWPSAFVDAVADWDDGDLQGFRKRADLRLRATDRFVQAITGVTPMSVSTDRMGSTAMLLAEVLSRSSAKLDRGRFERASAIDGVAEVHPAAALKCWTQPGGEPFSASRYRSGSSSQSREGFLTELLQSGIDVSPEYGADLLSSGDAIDALVCALVARAVAIGNTLMPTGSVDVASLVPKASAGPKGETIEQTTARLDLARAVQQEAQRTAPSEGWIHLPHRQDLSTALDLTPGSASWVPTPTPSFDPYARWSNGDGDRYADPDDYGPMARFVGDDDVFEASEGFPDDEFVLVRRRALERTDRPIDPRRAA